MIPQSTTHHSEHIGQISPLSNHKNLIAYGEAYGESRGYRAKFISRHPISGATAISHQNYALLLLSQLGDKLFGPVNCEAHAGYGRVAGILCWDDTVAAYPKVVNTPNLRVFVNHRIRFAVAGTSGSLHTVVVSRVSKTLRRGGKAYADVQRQTWLQETWLRSRQEATKL